MPAIATTTLTGDTFINGLLGEVKWATTSLTYSFPISGAYYEYPYGYSEPSYNFGALDSVQKATALDALEMISHVAAVTFTMATSSNHADIRLAMSDRPSTAWAYLPSTAPEGGDVWFNKSSRNFSKPDEGNYAFAAFIHELGHAMGLEHPHEHNVMPVSRDSMEYSIMSYKSYVGATEYGYTSEQWGFAQSLMIYDIAALQHMYGANYAANSGSTTYSWSPTSGEAFINGVSQGAPGANRIFQTIWDGGGNDTYDFSNYTSGLNVDLRPGEWITTSSSQLARLNASGSEVAVGNIANALLSNSDLRSLIENVNGGAGDDRVTGNIADNRIAGGNGADLLLGHDGADMLYGDAGNDLLGGGSRQDRLFGGTGDDGLDGGSGDDIAYGEHGQDHLVGDAGADYLSGGEGADRLFGGAEGDVIDGDAGDDLIGGGAGWDLLRGGIGNDVIDAGAGNDYLHGGDGNDILEGDIGSDNLYGGSGYDTFRFSSRDAATDTIWDFLPTVDRLLILTGKTVADVLSSVMVTDGGSTIVDVGDRDFVVVMGTTGIDEFWFA